MDAVNAFTRIRESAAGRTKPAAKVIDCLEPGDAIRQGDLYVIRLASLPEGAEVMAEAPMQLVPGRSRGSRHTITRETFAGCALYRLAATTELDGPVIVAREAFEISHPEHGHFVLPAGTYQVRYQRRWSSRLERAKD